MKSHGITGVDYQSVLSRKQNATKTTLACVGALLAQGGSVKLAQVNENKTDTSSKPERTLVDLPPYSWNHSQTYWGESRVSKQYRMREHSALSFIRALCPSIHETERYWRGYLRISEEPWISDHKIQTQQFYIRRPASSLWQSRELVRLLIQLVR